MPEKILYPSIEKRISSLVEFDRRRKLEATFVNREGATKPTITFSREFGCEAYPAAERLRELMEQRTDRAWLFMDRELLQEVARNNALSRNMLSTLGEKPAFLDEMLATFSPNWKSDKECYQILCKQLITMAAAGNVILMARGSSFVTQPMKNCYHFRLYASVDFRAQSLSRRLNISLEEARVMVEERQRQRDQFIRAFLDRDPHDLSPYHLLINNERNSTETIASTIANYVLEQ